MNRSFIIKKFPGSSPKYMVFAYDKSADIIAAAWETSGPIDQSERCDSFNEIRNLPTYIIFRKGSMEGEMILEPIPDTSARRTYIGKTEQIREKLKP